MLELLLGLVVGTLVSGTVLWVAMKLTAVDGTYVGMLAIALITHLIQFVPFIGWILSIVVMFVLIVNWTTAEFFPDAILMVVVSWLVGFFIMLAAAGALENLAA